METILAIVKLAPVSDQDSMRDITRAINKNFIRLAQMISDITERPQSFKQEVTVETEDGETVQVASGIASAGEAAKNAQDTATASKAVAENAEAAASEASELAALASGSAQAASVAAAAAQSSANTAQETAEAAQGDATTALSNAATAKGTADRAISDAAAAYGTASAALGNAAAAQTSADQANGILDQTVEQYADNTFSVGKSTGWNVWIGAANNAAGIFIREAQKIWAAFTQSAVAFYDGEGTAEVNQTAFFGNGSARIGKKTGTHVDIDSDGLEIRDGESVLASFGAEYDPDMDISTPYMNIDGTVFNAAGMFGEHLNIEGDNIEMRGDIRILGGSIDMTAEAAIIRNCSITLENSTLSASMNFKHGVVQGITTAANSVGAEQTVDFIGGRMKTTPNVVCTFGTAGTPVAAIGSCSIIVTERNADGFKFRICNASNGSRTLNVNWIAMA